MLAYTHNICPRKWTHISAAVNCIIVTVVFSLSWAFTQFSFILCLIFPPLHRCHGHCHYKFVWFSCVQLIILFELLFKLYPHVSFTIMCVSTFCLPFGLLLLKLVLKPDSSSSSVCLQPSVPLCKSNMLLPIKSSNVYVLLTFKSSIARQGHTVHQRWHTAMDQRDAAVFHRWEVNTRAHGDNHSAIHRHNHSLTAQDECSQLFTSLLYRPCPWQAVVKNRLFDCSNRRWRKRSGATRDWCCFLTNGDFIEIQKDIRFELTKQHKEPL